MLEKNREDIDGLTIHEGKNNMKIKKIRDNNEVILNDPIIRKKFILNNLEFFKKENTITVNEFGITKKRIADIFHFDFNTNISTIFEIKGEHDQIIGINGRLEGQLSIYSSYANIVYIIAFENHLNKIKELLDTKIYGKNIGIITVDKNINFKEYKRGAYSKCFFDIFIKNLDMAELKILCEEKNIKVYGSKNNIINYLKRHVTYKELIESLRNKLIKYYLKECPYCNSSLYYNKYFVNIKKSVCFECDGIYD